MATLTNPTPLPALSYISGQPFTEHPHHKEFERLCEEYDVIKFPVADGYAHYRVVSVSPPVLSHIPFCDGYTIPAAHVRGLNTNDLRNEIQRERRLKELFARKMES